MNNFSQSSKFVWVFAVIGVLAVATVIVVAFIVPKKTNAPQQQNQAENNNQEANEFRPTITKVSSEQLPDKFPADLPLEANAKIIDNYNASSKTGNLQATREYESAKSPEQNFTVYNDFFAKGGWEVLNSNNTAADRSMTVKKDQVIVQVLFYQNTISKASVVRVNATTLAKK